MATRAVEEEPVAHGAANEAKNIRSEFCGVEVESKVVDEQGEVWRESPLPDLPKEAAEEPDITELTDMADTEEKGYGKCASCGAPVEKKIAYFCRMNENRFGGKVLCRTCQSG